MSPGSFEELNSSVMSRISNTKLVTIYAGKFGDKVCVFALSGEAARNLVRSHFRYGEPGTDEYALGVKWAETSDDDGWRIEEFALNIPEVPVQLRIGNHGETSHAIWTCPVCNRSYSDRWTEGDDFPTLLACGCRDESRFLLGVILCDLVDQRG